MRPVNLIPPEDRRGDQAALRTGPLSYILIGGLVLVLVGVVALVLSGNQISERKDELATVKHEDAVAAAKAARLSSYTQFQDLSEARTQTVQSLADSRFNWERVMRELALILPRDVHLTELNATSSGEAGSEGGGSSSTGGLLNGVTGPWMAMTGCADGQDGVASFVAALRDIDGVTRVGVQSSSVTAESSKPSAGSGSATCGATAGTATFALVAAFDAAPVPSPESGEAEAEPAPETTQAANNSSEASGESGGESEGGG
jgi:Tfp pilus assembly protein PilN